MDLVKLREREEREEGRREGGREVFTTVCVRRRLEERREEERTRLDAETELLPLEPLKQPR